jgi:hypothetical protein
MTSECWFFLLLHEHLPANPSGKVRSFSEVLNAVWEIRKNFFQWLELHPKTEGKMCVLLKYAQENENKF